MHINRN